ncbi:MAG: alanine--tRNA ligase [Chloroflexi bacterium]|nr:alanine--tRNA ligase [Chloroflexota bacterium]
MTGPELRRLFLDYFRQKGHVVVPSALLIPHGDPTLLLTSAGMVQFKPYFMGEATPPAPRLTSCQKCFRTTDIESVGNERNLTFFEMLGNFSIGDYVKEGAVEYAWELSTERLKLPAERIWITIYPTDDEAEAIWRDRIGIPVERIVRHEENWWGPAGNTGPCGPDSELYLDRGAELGCGKPECAPGCSCPRFLEFWNLVFMQYFQDEAGQRTPLPRKNIDTGMGLERLTMMLQGAPTVYDTDLFRPIIDQACALTGRRFGESAESDFSLRVIADHSRAVTFLIADGVLPGNEGRGYILRRILRRAVRHGRRLGLDQPFLVDTSRTVVDLFGAAYPELVERRAFVERVIGNEETKFGQTLQFGLAVLDEAVEDLKARGQRVIPGELAFRLHDTYGFPRELTAEVAAEQGLALDEAGFEAAMERQREQARQAARFGGVQRGDVQVYQQVVAPPSVFVGYGRLAAESEVTAVLDGGRATRQAEAGRIVEIVLRETPFYAEAGGQVGDTGWIVGPHGRAEVLDTQRPLEALVVHRARVAEGWLEVGERVRAEVDGARRADIVRNHTATHLLHRALRDVLGTHVQQAGSLVAPDRLRFDFTHLAPLTEEERLAVERAVGERIREDLPVSATQTTYQAAIGAGALAFFGEKYGATVRMVSTGEYSRELCGGTHVAATGQIGALLVVSETGVGAGLRRIEALTGRGAEEHVREHLRRLEHIAHRLGGDPEVRVEALLAELQQARRQVHELQRQIAQQEVERLLGQAQDVDGLRVVSGDVRVPDRAALLELGDALRARIGRGVVVLGSVMDDKPAFIAMVTPDVHVHAGQLIRQIAALTGGSGGGKPEVAQAGGKDARRMPEALRAVPGLVASMLKR